MKYLLDTNVVLWLIEDNKKLGTHARQLLLPTDYSQVTVSIISLWEVYIKISIGKLTFDRDLEKFLVDQEIKMLSVLPKHTKQILTLPHLHSDPFDRLLIAQALNENLTFVTGDGDLLQYPGVSFIDARK